jgi:2-C-methyl-D-erythritol 4-phosphate cytidylyltransferase
MIRSIVVVHTPGQNGAERCRREVLEPLGLTSRVVLTPGGERRQDSSLHGIQALPIETLHNPESLVMVHDAARPLVSPFLITHCLRELRDHPDAMGVLPALPIRETLKRVEDSWIRSTVDRAGLWGAQTPQVFRLGRLVEAHRRAAKEGWAVTDDAGLLEAAGMPLRIIPGDLENLKVTYPEDRIFAERLLRQRESA